MDTVTEDNLLQQSDVDETIITSTPKQDKPPSATPKRKLSGAARRKLKKAKEGLAGGNLKGYTQSNSQDNIRSRGTSKEKRPYI